MTKPFVLVIGMHRSGTSLAMQALEKLNVGFGGQLLAGDKFNRNGYFEAPECIAFHDDILAELGQTWGSPEHGLSIDPRWFEEECCHAHTKTATKILSERLEHTEENAALALKDPRATLFLPIWLQAAEALSLETRIVICVRHPSEVAMSLEKRDKLGRKLSELYWLTYVASAFHHTKSLPRALLIFNDWQTGPATNLRKLADLLPGENAPVDDAIFDKKNIGHDPEQEELSEYLNHWWMVLTGENSFDEDIERLADLHIKASGSFRSVANSIRAEVGDTPSYLLDRDLQNYRKQLTELTKKYNADQSWIAEQSAALKEQGGLVEELKQSLVTKEEELAEYKRYKSEAADLQESIIALTQDRDAQTERAKELLAAYQSSETQTAEIQAALRKVEHERDAQVARAKELHEAYQTSETRIENLQAARDGVAAERDAQADRAIELHEAYQTSETRVENLQATLVGLAAERDALLARAEELLAAYQTSEARISDLETSLAEAAKERDASADHARELLAAMQSEREANEILRQKLRRLNPFKWFQA